MMVCGVLLDLEGVLYQGDEPVRGARDAVAALRQAGLALRFLTNTTTRPRSYICARMAAMGFEAALDDIFSPAMAAGRFLEQAGVTRIHLAAPAGLAEDFGHFALVDDDPEAAVIGDLYTGFTWQRVNGLFQMALGGARIVALHKNRFCRRAEGLSLDVGPFVAALEYAAGAEAAIMGKPSPAFFHMALESLGLAPGEVVMVGDDIEADIGGAQDAGLRAIQVETGKYSDRDREHPTVTPDECIASVVDLPALIARMR